MFVLHLKGNSKFKVL